MVVRLRFLRPDAGERHLIWVSRLVTAALMVVSGAAVFLLSTAGDAFQLLLTIGAGTGLLYLLRWFWWRINAWSEISAMVISFLVAVYFQFFHTALGFPPLDSSLQLVIGVAITSVGWLTVTFLTPPATRETLSAFYREIRPFGSGWRRVLGLGPEEEGPVPGGLSAALMGWFLGVSAVYGALFGVGFLLYGNVMPGLLSLVLAALAMAGIFRVLPRAGIRG